MRGMSTPGIEIPKLYLHHRSGVKELSHSPDPWQSLALPNSLP